MTHLKIRANQVLSPVIGRYTDIEISHGKGCYLYDTNDNAYLDFSSGIAVTSTGHCHPDIVKAIQNQAETLIHPCIGMGYYDKPIELAEKITQLLAPTPYSVFFNQSGSEAIETAIKLAMYVQKKNDPKKHKIVAFKGGFHGRTVGALSLTTSKLNYREGYESLLYPVDFLDYPNTYRGSQTIDNMVTMINTTPLLNQNVAAVIIEPILGEGGYYIAPTPVLQALETRCQALGIYLIVDEIQTGIGRTGTWFYHQQCGISPDIITLAKGMGSGLPLATCMAKKEIMDNWPPGAHGGTYGGNPVTCAAGLATLSVIEPHLSDIAPLGTQAIQYLQKTIGNHPYIGDIRGKGLMIGIEFVQNKTTKVPHPTFMKQVMKICLEHHLIIISCGIHDNVIRLIPPLIIDQETLMKGLTIFTEVLQSIKLNEN